VLPIHPSPHCLEPLLPCSSIGTSNSSHISTLKGRPSSVPVLTPTSYLHAPTQTYVQGVTKRCGEILVMSSTYQNKEEYSYQHVSGNINLGVIAERVYCMRFGVDVLSNEVLSISLFHQCSLQMRHHQHSQPTPVGRGESSWCNPFQIPAAVQH
jgi:hypothetical protein